MFAQKSRSFSKKYEDMKGCNIVSSFIISTSFSSSYSDDPALPKHGPLSIIPISAFDGYVSPSGGLISYGCFDIKGKIAATKNRTRRYFEAQTEELACKLAEDGGMIGPFQISVRLEKTAESWQLSELRIYNIISDPIPYGLSYWDIRTLHERISNHDESPVPFDFAHMAFQFGVKFSRCSGLRTILKDARSLPPEQYKELLSTLHK